MYLRKELKAGVYMTVQHAGRSVLGGICCFFTRSLRALARCLPTKCKPIDGVGKHGVSSAAALREHNAQKMNNSHHVSVCAKRAPRTPPTVLAAHAASA